MKLRCCLLLLLLVLTGCARPAATCPSTPAPTLLPAPRWCVVLDFGHGGADGGAVGTDTGMPEAELNLQVGLQVATFLTEAGAEVVLTRTGADALAPTKREDMRVRGQILSTEGADVTVSIHMNKFRDRSVRGPMVYYQTGSEPEEGSALAQSVIDALTCALSLPARLANPGDNYVTRVPKVPSVLIECGFLSNADEERLLQDPAYQTTLARAIADGVIAYLDGPREAG